MGRGDAVVRWLGLLGVGARRTLTRASGPDRRSVLLGVAGVAVAVAMFVVVTGVAMGLVSGTAVTDGDVDYWIVPESSEGSSLVAADGPQFGEVHATSADLAAREDIDAVSPVLSDVVRVESANGAEYVLVVGVVGSSDLGRLAGVDTGPLTPGDPFYADGSYDGEWTGEVVLSGGAASLLEVSEGDGLTVGGTDTFVVAGVDEPADGADVPTAVVHLSELQVLTGAQAHDQADQFVVRTTSPAVRADLEGVYPSSEVRTRSEMTAASTMASDLPLAMIVGAFAVTVVIGTLFVVTTSGLALVADTPELRTLRALGLSTRSQLGLVAAGTVVTTALGGAVGAVAGYGAIHLLNAVAGWAVSAEAVALPHPGVLPLGIAAGLVVGVVSLPYLWVVTHRVSRGVPA